MDKLAEEFRDVLGLYVRFTADLARIADAGNSEEAPQALIQSILDNRSCLTEIQQLNKRLERLYGVWKDKEANFSLPAGDEIRGVVNDVRAQMQQLEKLCSLGIQKIEARRKQLSDELANVGKGSRYLKMIRPVQENHPKFIDSAY
jgi:hypothetical protein